MAVLSEKANGKAVQSGSRIEPDKARNSAVYLKGTQAVEQRSMATIIEAEWGFSSAGRAPALQAGGRRFDPVNLHQYLEIKQEPIFKP
jgi:hypothetical protein